MIHIVRSHNLEILSDLLAEKLKQTASDDPLIPQKIIVPNLDTARWFKLHLAEKNGITANMECLLPAEWQWKQIRKCYPKLSELLPSDLSPMKWSIYQLMMDTTIRQEFLILEEYISAQPKERKQQAAFQLSGQIASVFDQYLVYRPEMMLRWQKGYLGKGDEKWQAELWRILNQSWKKIYRDERRLNRAELYQEVVDAFLYKKIKTDETLFILNPGLLPLPTMKLLNMIREDSEIFAYQIEPSSLLNTAENELLQVFGREAESIRYVMDRLVTSKKDEIHPENNMGSPLQSIQNAMITGRSIRELDLWNDQLKGIEIRSCHSPLREIETLHQFLLELFEEDENLHPDDILVATPDLDMYRPFIKAVFDHSDEDLPRIPYHLGRSKTDETGLRCGLLQLLSLIDSRFQFSAVMDLFMMRPVYQAVGITESDASTVKSWMEENHVVWGLDGDHRREWDQPGEENQTWGSALRSGWLGQWFGGEKGDFVDDVLLYQSVQSTTKQELWASFSHFLHLLDQMRKEQKQDRTGSEWAGWLTRWMGSLFDKSSIGSLEGQLLLSILDQIRNHSETAGCKELIPFSLFKNECMTMMDRHKAAGAMFSNGVIFSTMVPVRSIPFKVIALIGLNENTFPRKQNSPDFDLMAKELRIGERNRKNEDRNLFLESILAAKQVHYCSYIGQSQVDNETIPPSTIVSEWVDILSRVSGLETEQIIKKESLNGFSPSNFDQQKSYSKTYFQTVQNLLNDEESVSGFVINRPLHVEEPTEIVEIDELTNFYSNPIRWFLRNRFEVYLREPDEEKKEFAVDNLQAHILFQRVFGWVLNGMSDDLIHRYLISSGTVPSGWQGEKKVRQLKCNVYSAIEALRAANINPELSPREFSIELDSVRTEGVITSYSEHRFVDVSPSSFSGRVAVNSWLGHLCGFVGNLYKEKESYLFSDLKKGNTQLYKFSAVPDAKKMLEEIVELYKTGLAEPQTFFPKTIYEYVEKEEKKGHADALKKAASTFEGGDWSFGEREDLSILTLMGEGVSFRSEFITERYQKVIRQMRDHMEKMS